MTWTQVLDGIRAEHEALKSESEALTGKYATTPADDLRSDHFYVDHTPHGLYQVLFRFDARKFFDLKGRCCFYALDDPFTGMLYYDTLITFLFPCPKDHFNTVHAFRIEDTERIRELQAQKRLVLVLASPPDEYRPFDYLQAFCECGKTSFVPWCPHIVSLFRDSDLKHDELTESISEIPSIRNAIRRRAEIGRETYAATEFGVMAALQDLHYRGLHDLKAFLWKLLLTEPDLGLAAIYATRRVLLNPLDVAPDMPHCREYRQVVADFWQVGRGLQLKNLSFPGELGALLATELSFPCPTSWDALAWCRDHLDVPKIRTAFSVVETESVRRLAESPHTLDDFRQLLQEIWRTHAATATRTKELIFWGGSLSIGAAGTAISGPLVGLLAALGITTASNLLLGPFSEGLARLLQRKAFHIWDVKRSLGRKT